MSGNFMAFRPSPARPGNLITPKCRMVWPHLFKATVAKGSEATAKPKYQLTLLIPKDVDMAPLEKAMLDTKIAEFGQAPIPKLKLGVHRTAEQERLQEYAADYPFMLRTSSSDKPEVVYTFKDPATGKLAVCDDEADVYGGRWCVASINPYAWSHPTGGKGVSLGLSNVQLHNDDEPIAANRVAASNEFEAVDDGSGGAPATSDAIFGATTGAAGPGQQSSSDSLFGGLR